MTRDELLRLYPAHHPRLVAALSRLVSPAEAEDIAQETLLRALAAVGDFRGEAALGTWLHRIGRNLAYDRLRRKAHEADEMHPEEVAASPPSDPLEGAQMSCCVRELLAALPASQRDVLVQADMLERTTAEIARDTGISVGNAKIRLHRARKTMKTMLEERCSFYHDPEGIRRCAPKEGTR